MHYFWFYFPEALLNKLHGMKRKKMWKEATWFYLKSLDAISSKLWSFVLAANSLNLPAFGA